MSPTHCIHKTLDRAQDGLHYCIDCRKAFTVSEWVYNQPEPKVEAHIPVRTPEDTVSDSTVPTWVARMYRWLMVVGVLLLITTGFVFFCNKTSEAPESNPKVASLVKNATPEKESCQKVADLTKQPRPEPKPEIILPKTTKPLICEPKIVYVPSPNKCECTEAIKAACGETREAVKSILRDNWHDSQVRDSKSKYRMPGAKIKPSEEEYRETEDLKADSDFETYKEDDDSDGNGWFK